MADSEKGTPQYSMQDMARIFSDLTYGENGMLANTVFSNPYEAYEYDSVAETSVMNSKAYFDKYLNIMTQVPMLRRQKSLAAASGLGEKLIEGLRMLMAFSPGTAMNVMQHHGGDQAIATFLEMSNAMSMARGGTLGGVTSPLQLSDNMKYAASQGALAYRNNFNRDGTINVDQTHGLSLPATALIAGRTLSDRSQYESWAKRMSAKGVDLTKEELKLDINEINNFRDGVGATARAEKSFNEQIKKFTEQINKFVSSVSKMTGDYNSAIEFLQRLTSGKLFSAGESAARAREVASRMALNMRVAAADAGMTPMAAAYMTGHFMEVGDYAAGFNERSRIYNQSPIVPMLGALSTMGYAKWSQMNPYATDREKLQAKQASEDWIENYINGDMYRLNALAAYLIDSDTGGSVDKNEVLRLNREGNAPKLSKYLADNFGGESRVAEFINDRKNIEMVSMNHSETLKELHAAAFADGGMAQENMRKGAHKLVNRFKKNFSSEQVRYREQYLRRMESELGVSRTETMLEDETLQDIIKDSGKRDEFIKNAKEFNYSEKEILEKVGRFGGSSKKLLEKTDAKMISAAEAKYGAQSAQVKQLRKNIENRDAYAIERRIDELHVDALLDDNALMYAGMTDKRRRDNLRNEARRGKWSSDRIREYIVNNEKDVDLALLDYVSNGRLVDLAEADFGSGSFAVKNLKAGIAKLQGPTDLGRIQKSAYADMIVESKDQEFQDLQAAIRVEKNTDRRNTLMGRLDEVVKQGVLGKNGYITTDRSYLENLFSSGLKDADKLSPEKKKEYVDTAINSFMTAINGGASVESAFRYFKDQSGVSDKFDSDVYSETNRVKAFEKTEKEQTLTNVMRSFARETDIANSYTVDEFEQKMVEAHKLYTEAKKENPDAADEVLFAKKVLPTVFKEKLTDKEKIAEPILKDLSEGRGSLYDTMTSAAFNYKTSIVKADRAAVLKSLDKTLGAQRLSALSESAIASYEKNGETLDKEKYKKELKKLQENPLNANMSHSEFVLEALKATVGEDKITSSEKELRETLRSAEVKFDTNSEKIVNIVEPFLNSKRERLVIEDIGRRHFGFNEDKLRKMVEATTSRMSTLREEAKKRGETVDEDRLLQQSIQETVSQMESEEVSSEVLKNFNTLKSSRTSTERQWYDSVTVPSGFKKATAKAVTRKNLQTAWLEDYAKKKGISIEEARKTVSSKKSEDYQKMQEQVAERMEQLFDASSSVTNTDLSDKETSSLIKESYRKYSSDNNIGLSEKSLNNLVKKTTDKISSIKEEYKKQGKTISDSEALQLAVKSTYTDVRSEAATKEILHSVVSMANRDGPSNDITSSLKESYSNYIKNNKLRVDEKTLNSLVSSTTKKVSEIKEASKKEGKQISEEEAYSQAISSTLKENNLVPAGGKGGAELASSIKAAHEEFQKSVTARMRRETLSKAYTENMAELFGNAAGENSVDAYYQGRNKAQMQAPIQAGMRALFGDLSAKVVSKSDDRQTEAHNKQYGQFTGKNLERIERQLNVVEKMDKMSAAKKELLTKIDANRDGKTGDTQEQLAHAFSEFNKEYGGLSDNDYRAKFKQQFGKDGLNILDALQKDMGITLREAVTSYAAGGDKSISDEERRSREKAAYMEEHINAGAPELSKDQELAGYLSRIADATDKIAQQQVEGQQMFK